MSKILSVRGLIGQKIGQFRKSQNVTKALASELSREVLAYILLPRLEMIDGEEVSLGDNTTGFNIEETVVDREGAAQKLEEIKAITGQRAAGHLDGRVDCDIAAGLRQDRTLEVEIGTCSQDQQRVVGGEATVTHTEKGRRRGRREGCLDVDDVVGCDRAAGLFEE